MINTLNLYQEVEILPTAPESLQAFVGKKGVIVGISEEDGILYGYGVWVHGENEIDCFDGKDLKPTGKQFNREDFC